jgi:hypothetical protein
MANVISPNTELMSFSIDFIIGEYSYAFTPRSETSLKSYPNKRGEIQKGFFIMKPGNDFMQDENIKRIIYLQDSLNGSEIDLITYALKKVRNYIKDSKGCLQVYNGPEVRLFKPEHEITYRSLSSKNYSLLSKLER